MKAGKLTLKSHPGQEKFSSARRLQKPARPEKKPPGKFFDVCDI
jgi:hypothetical protein